MYFTEGEVQEMRTRLPLVTISVVDSLVSYSASSALSANQGRVLGERVSFLEGRISALLHIETVHPWTGDSGIYSMVSAPDDTLNNVTNARVAYELKKRTDDLASRVTAIEAAIQSMSGGGGGGGTYILPVASDVTLGGVKIGSNSGLSIDAYGNLSVTGGGGGGTGGGWIGTTAVQANQTSGQNLTGIGSATLSGNLSVAGTSTLTGNVFVAGTKIYFGSSTAAPYLEYNSNGFHFSHGVYSDSFVSAGGIGSGGGGDGTGDNTWRPVYVGGTTQQYKVLDSSTSNPLVFTGNGVVWDNESSSVKIDANPNSVLYTLQSLTSAQQLQARTNINAQESFLPTLATGYLKYTAGTGWSFDSSTSGVSVASDWTGSAQTRVHVGSVNGVDFYAPRNTDSWRNVYAYYGGVYQEVLSSDSSDSLKFDENDFGWSQSSGIYLRAGGSPSSDSWRPMRIKSTSSSSSSVLVDSSATNQYGTLEFCGGTNVTLSSSTTTTTSNVKVTQLTINATSSGPGSDSWRPVYVNSDLKLNSAVNDNSGLNIVGNIVSWVNSSVKIELPAASSDTLGGIKVGNGLSISTSGVLSTTIGSLNTNNSTALSVSSNESFGNTISLHKVSKTGSYADLLNRPTLAAVATSGSYSDLINKPTFATVATSGSYSDLLNKPTLPSTYVTALDDLSDVTVSSMSSSDDRKHLIYDSSSQQWIADRIDFVKSTTFPASWVKIGELDGTELSVPLASENQVGIVGNGLLTPQRFSGKKVFAWDVAIGKVTHLYTEGPAIGTYAKFYIGEEADGYYMTYNSTDKCLHLYCGTGVSGSGTKLKIHGNVDIDGDVAVTGDIVANGSITAGA